MRHGQGTRYNTDVHDALSVIKKYNANQEIDEAPYSLGQRALDTGKSWVPLSRDPGGMRRMAKGRKDSGNLANDVNKQWQTHLGKAGHMNQDAVTIKDLSDFIERTWPGTDPSAFYKKVGIVATNDDSIIPKKSQEKVILSLAQSVNSAGGGSTADATSTATGGPKNKPVDKNRDGIDDVTNMPVAPDGGGGLGDKARSGVDLAKSATSSKSAGGPPDTTDTTDPTDTPTSDDPNTNKVLSLDPPEVQGPKGIAWKKGTDGRWKMSVHPFKIADPKLVPELDKILSGGTPAAKPNAKQAELINFVTALDDRRRTELKNIILDMASKVPAVGGR